MRTRSTRRVVLGVALLGLWAPGPPAAAAPLLPDLDQLVPTQVSVTPAAGGRYHLGFDSRIANGPENGRGVGPLILRARRSNTGAPMMADQVIRNADGSETIRPSIGRLNYETAVDHSHWHYEGLDHYELRRASNQRLVRPANKAGFCMPDKLFTPDRCGTGRPTALAIDQGLGAGFVDLYQAYLEGQSIDVTGVKGGVYYLVHRVNVDSSLCESNLSNNAAAAKVRLWPNGYGVAPYVRVLRDIELFPIRRLQSAPANCPLDRRAPRVRVRIPAGQHIGRSRAVVAEVRCSERCTVHASARIQAAGRSKHLGNVVKGNAKRKRVRLRVRLRGGAMSAVGQAARRRQLVRVRLTLRAVDAVGNRSRKTRVTALLRP